MPQVKHLARCAWIAAILAFVCVPMFGGIRGPGKYSGVVFFDRWDTCVLISGPYLMYISDKLKWGLRSFTGQSVEVDAVDVLQPINPGDGLIRKYNWVGPAPEPHRFIKLDGLELLAKLISLKRAPTIVIGIQNPGTETVTVLTGEIGITVFGARHSSSGFSPSDGQSEAVITRSHLMRSLESSKSSDGFHAGYSADQDIPPTITLRPGGVYNVTLTFDISPGEYQFVLSYGGGVHEEKSLLSNAVSFDVLGEASNLLPDEKADLETTSGPPRVHISEAVGKGLLLSPAVAACPVECARCSDVPVKFEVEVNKSGTVTRATVIRADSLLTEAASVAVKSWRYKPYTLNGNPVDFVTYATVSSWSCAR